MGRTFSLLAPLLLLAACYAEGVAHVASSESYAPPPTATELPPPPPPPAQPDTATAARQELCGGEDRACADVGTDTDPVALYAKAKEMATAMAEDAKLETIEVHALSSGDLDTSMNEPAAVYTFKSVARDTTLPVGHDVVKQTVTVAVERGLLVARHVTEHVVFARVNEASAPACPMSKAWEAVVASGIPSDAVADAAYARTGPKTCAWRFSVRGQSDRWVEGEGCALRERWQTMN